MAKRKYEEFRCLLRGAISTRRQAQFANDSGISAEHLSRMLNAEEINRPTRNTLLKIAAVAKNGITYQMLSDALDRGEPKPNSQSDMERARKYQEAVSDFTLSFEELAENSFSAFLSALQEEQYPIITVSLDLTSFIEQIVAYASDKKECLPISYDIGDIRDYYGTFYSDADKYVKVSLSVSDGKKVAESEVLIYFSSTPRFHVIQHISMSIRDIWELYGMPPAVIGKFESAGLSGEKALDEAMKEPFYMDISPVSRFHEKYIPHNGCLTDAIFGEEVVYHTTVFGSGFWLENIPDFFADFVNHHLTSIVSAYDDEDEDLRSALISALTETYESVKEKNLFIANIFEEFGYSDYVSDDRMIGWAAAVSNAMTEETGFEFHYWRHVDDVNDCSDKDCIMIESSDLNGLCRESLLNILCRYARELGIPQFGDIFFKTMRRRRWKPVTYYVRRTVNVSEEEESINYSCKYKPGDSMPAKSGVYHILLKDGRSMECVYVAGKDLWLRFHREWSDLIDSFCPDMVQIENMPED